MKKIRLLSSLLLVVAFLAACTPAGETVLTVAGQEYTQLELESLGTQSVDYTNKDGEVTTYTGVPLSALLEDAGIVKSDTNLTFIAVDDYEAVLSIDEALACTNCLIAFDDGSLRAVMPGLSSKLQVKDLVSISVE